MTPKELIAVTYQVPSFYTNNVQFTYINGLFRITFLEQNLTSAPESPEVQETLAPRISVTLTPETLAEMLRQGGELYDAAAALIAKTNEAAAFATPGGSGASN